MLKSEFEWGRRSASSIRGPSRGKLAISRGHLSIMARQLGTVLLSPMAINAMACGCALRPLPAKSLQPVAFSTAQQRGAADLGCPAATAQILSKETIQYPQEAGSSETPRRAAYTIDVSGCGTRTTYLVSCDDRQKDCVAGTLQKKTEGEPQLADKLRPDAMKAAQLRGDSDFGCLTATTEVLRQETIEEGQTTGGHEPPHRAVYSIAVSGCGKRTTYDISCDGRKKGSCVVGTVQTPARE